MTKAREGELGELHKRVAQSMRRALEAPGHATVLLVKYGEELPDEVRLFLREQSNELSPQLFQAAAKFLKDNDITADPEQTGEEMTDLQKRLNAKKKVSSIPVQH